MAYILFNEQENFKNLMKILSRISFFFYWAFDNISILSKIKLFNLNFEKLYRIGYTFWFFALIFMNSTLIYQLYISKAYYKLKIEDDESQSDNYCKIPQNCPLLPDFQIQIVPKVVEIKQKNKEQIRREKMLNLIKNTCDLIPSGKDSQILKLIFNRVVPQKVVGICGCMSGLISIYQTILQINEEGSHPIEKEKYMEVKSTSIKNLEYKQ